MYRALEAGEPVLVRSYDPVSDFFEDENTEDASRPIDSDLYFQNDALFGEQYIGATDEDDSLVFSDDDSVTSLDLDDQLSLSGEDHKAPTIVFEEDTDFALFEDDTHVIVTTKTWPVYWRNRRLVACAILGCTLLAGLFKLGACLGNAPVASVQERSFRRANETSLGKSISLASSQYFLSFSFCSRLAPLGSERSSSFDTTSLGESPSEKYCFDSLSLPLPLACCTRSKSSLKRSLKPSLKPVSVVYVSESFHPKTFQ